MADISPARLFFTMEHEHSDDKNIIRRGLARTKELAENIKDSAKNLITMGTLKPEDAGIRPRVRTDSFGRKQDPRDFKIVHKELGGTSTGGFPLNS